MPAPQQARYRRIMAEIVGQIDDGSLPPHTALPSTERLAEQYGVSRNTVRQAIALLVETGVLYGQQGRGVFVAERPASAGSSP